MPETWIGLCFKIPAFLYLYLVLLCFQLCAAQSQISLNVQLFDHNYGDFKNDFDDAVINKCGGNVNQFNKGMVADTLGFDAVTNQKLLIPNASLGCADSLEKWFDAATSRTTSCGTLTLQNNGTAQNPDFKYLNPNFFLMDSASQQVNWTNKNGTALKHDFSYCMEVSASMRVGTGQTMKFQSDDDLFVYLDNRLVVDQGGAHFPIETVTALDTLKFLQSKKGKNIDMDIFYCSRVPPTSQLGMETNFVLNPQSVKRLSIVDSAGSPLRSQDVVVGKSKLCARANYQSLAKPICGEKTNPLDSALVKADWDLNGKIISALGGSECIDLNPQDFPKVGRLDLTAATESKKSRISISMIRPVTAAYALLKGNGKAESVEIILDTASATVNDGLQIKFEFQGRRQSADVYPIQSQTNQGLVGERLVGPIDFNASNLWGVSSTNPIPAQVTQSLFGQQFNSAVMLTDGMSPVITKANYISTPNKTHSAAIEVMVSELITNSQPPKNLFQLKNKKREVLQLSETDLSCSEPNPFCHRLVLTAETIQLISKGDSLSLTSVTEDSLHNQALPNYVEIQFPGTYNGQVGEITFRENPVRGHNFSTATGESFLIPVSENTTPILNSAVDLLFSSAHGPIIIIPTTIPISKIDLWIYDNLGQFVNSTSRKFSEQDWGIIKQNSKVDTTWLRLMWTPIARNGAKLATGIYIIQGDVESKPGVTKTNNNGVDEISEYSRFHLKPKLMGFIRD